MRAEIRYVKGEGWESRLVSDADDDDDDDDLTPWRSVGLASMVEQWAQKHLLRSGFRLGAGAVVSIDEALVSSLVELRREQGGGQ